MRKCLSVALSFVLVFSVCLVETGCSQAQFDANVQKVQAQIPNLVNTTSAIAALTSNSELAAVIARMAVTAQTDLTALQATADAYLANKSSGNKTALVAAASTLASMVNAAVLEANGIKSAESEKSALTALAVFAVAVNGFAIALGVSVAATNYQAVRPFVPRQEEERVAAVYGTTLAQAGL